MSQKITTMTSGDLKRRYRGIVRREIGAVILIACLLVMVTIGRDLIYTILFATLLTLIGIMAYIVHTDYRKDFAKLTKSEQESEAKSQEERKTHWLTSPHAKNALSYQVLVAAGIISAEATQNSTAMLKRQLHELEAWIEGETPKPKKRDNDKYYRSYDSDREMYEKLVIRKMTTLSTLAQPVLEGLSAYIDADEQAQQLLQPKTYAIDPQNTAPREWEILERYFEKAKPIEEKLQNKNLSDAYRAHAHDVLHQLAGDVAEQLSGMRGELQSGADSELLNAISSSGVPFMVN